MPGIEKAMKPLEQALQAAAKESMAQTAKAKQQAPPTQAGAAAQPKEKEEATEAEYEEVKD